MKKRKTGLFIGLVILIIYFTFNSTFVILPNAYLEDFRDGNIGEMTMDEGSNFYLLSSPLRFRFYNILNVEEILKRLRNEYRVGLESSRNSAGTLRDKMEAMGTGANRFIQEYRQRFPFLNKRHLLVIIEQDHMPHFLIRNKMDMNTGMIRVRFQVLFINLVYILVLLTAFILMILNIKKRISHKIFSRKTSDENR